MTSSSSYFRIHSPSIPIPTESDSSFQAFRTPTDHQIVTGPPQRFPLAPVELAEEMEEKRGMSTNAQIVANSALEQCFYSLPRKFAMPESAYRGAVQAGLFDPFSQALCRQLSTLESKAAPDESANIKLARRHDSRECEIRIAAAVWTLLLEKSPSKTAPFLGASIARRSAMHAVIAKPSAAEADSFQGGFHLPKVVNSPTTYSLETDRKFRLDMIFPPIAPFVCRHCRLRRHLERPGFVNWGGGLSTACRPASLRVSPHRRYQVSLLNEANIQTSVIAAKAAPGSSSRNAR
jgi:hypothetical protein